MGGVGTVTIDNPTRFDWYGNTIIGEVRRRSNKETLRIATLVLQNAIANCPYDNSPTRDPEKPHLRDSGKILLVKGNVAEVRFTAPYALFVHDGTTKMEARPFLAQAILLYSNELAYGPKKIFKEDKQQATPSASRGMVILGA
jgi:hypothetical protein